MHIHDEDIDGVRGFRISGLPSGETVQAVGESLEVEGNTIQKWSIAAEILRLIKHRLKDCANIPETMIPLGERCRGDIGFMVAKDPDTRLAIRLTWVQTEDGLKFSAEIWPKGRSGPWVVDSIARPGDMDLPMDLFSTRCLLPVAACLANALMLGPNFYMTAKP